MAGKEEQPCNKSETHFGVKDKLFEVTNKGVIKVKLIWSKREKSQKSHKSARVL